MSSTNPAPDENEHVLGKLLGSCTAQLNWYTSNPDKLHFAAPHRVLSELTEQISEHYETCKANEGDVARRNRDYMRFYNWTQSEEFRQEMGGKYQFSEPYIVGSSWSPMRRIDSVCDVVMSVYQGNTVFNQVPKDAMDAFVLAFCKKFLRDQNDWLYVKHNTIIMQTADFSLSVRLTAITQPPFAARLTAAINQYEDFLPGFNAFCFVLHSWRQNMKEFLLLAESLAVPSSHTMTLLIVHFLQYYEEIPHFFVNPAVPNSSYLVGYSLHDILKFKMPAYHQTLVFNHRELQEKRKGSAPSIGELLIMFFYHYGYLADLVNYDVSLTTNDFNMRGDWEYLGLSVSDTEDFHGTEVPDAYKFQFLCREAFHIIKNAQNPLETLERVLRMQMDLSFSVVRDRQMMSDVATNFHYERASRNSWEFHKYPENRTLLPGVDRFLISECGDVVHWNVRPGVAVEPEPEPEPNAAESVFTEQKHALRGNLKGLKNIGENPFPMPINLERSSKMLMLTRLPNPKNPAEILVLFRPPLINNLRVIDDPMLEPSAPLHSIREPWFSQQAPTAPSFVSLIQQGCQQEQNATEHSKLLYRVYKERYEDVNEKNKSEFLAKMAKKRAKKPARVERAEPESEFAKMFMERAKELSKQSLEYWNQWGQANANGEKKPVMKALQNFEFHYEPDVRSGMVSCKKIGEMYDTLRASWLAELDAIIQPNTEYSGFDYC